MHRSIRIAVLCAALALAVVLPAASGGQGTDSTTDPALTEGPSCEGQKALAKQAYTPTRWWKTADSTPATKREDNKLDVFFKRGCPKSVRRQQKVEYWDFYRKTIAPCKAVGRRWANCAVAQCESGFGTGGSSIYGFTVYWAAISVLPVKGNRTGTRFASSSFSATKLEQDVVAAAAFKYGPTPGTCAS